MKHKNTVMSVSGIPKSLDSALARVLKLCYDTLLALRTVESGRSCLRRRVGLRMMS